MREIPESYADGIDEKIETATIIKEDEELTSWIHTLSSQMSSHTSCKVRQKSRPRCVEKLQNALDRREGESNSCLREGKLDEQSTSSCCASPLVRKERALNEREQECGRALDSVESFSCSRANGFAARRSAYETCYTSVLTRHSSKKSFVHHTIDAISVLYFDHLISCSPLCLQRGRFTKAQ